MGISSNDMAELDLGNITVADQMWKSGASYSYKSKCRPYYGICFIISGMIRYKTEHEEIAASAGDIVILKKNSHYVATFSVPETRDILINFNCISSAEGAEKSFFYDVKSDIIIFKSRMDLQKSFCDALRYEMTNSRKCMVKSILFKIIDEICSFEENDTVFKRIKQEIDNDAEFALSEPELAKRCSVSVSTFQRTFKRVYKKTVSEYRNELRVAKAKELLITGRYTVEEIAELSGFCDSSYFSRCFKRSEGLSPKKYLKQYYTI